MWLLAACFSQVTLLAAWHTTTTCESSLRDYIHRHAAENHSAKSACCFNTICCSFNEPMFVHLCIFGYGFPILFLLQWHVRLRLRFISRLFPSAITTCIGLNCECRGVLIFEVTGFHTLHTSIQSAVQRSFFFFLTKCLQIWADFLPLATKKHKHIVKRKWHWSLNSTYTLDK